MTEQVSANISANIRQLRDIRGLTQQQLANVSGIPRTTWAHLESGSANPTVLVLVGVAAALQVTVEELLGPPRTAVKHYRADSLPRRRRGLVVVRNLLPDAVPGFQIERMELPSGASMAGIPHTPGTREYLTCEQGQIELTLSGESWVLMPGDVLVFRGDQKHSYRNPALRDAVAYSVIALGNLGK